MYTAEDHDTAEVREAEEFRDTMSGSEREVEVVMGTTTPPRNNLTQRIYRVPQNYGRTEIASEGH